MYITYNTYIMKPYIKTNFGNTHTKLLNLPSENVPICNTCIVP